jgi:Protein of unknown function (DUF742)
VTTPPGGDHFDHRGQHGSPHEQQPLTRFDFPSGSPGHDAGTAPGYRQPSRQQRIQPYATPPQGAPPQAPTPRSANGMRATPVGSDSQPLVRPYAMTGGRTRPRYQLAIEALVSTTAEPVQLRGQLPEHQRICILCREIKSVAEISALLSIPLGVARILVADLAEAGLVAIHQPGGDEAAGGQPDVTLLERVLSGLRKL